MVRIAGITLQENQRVEYALTTVFGIGWVKSGKILDQVGVDKKKRVKEVTEEEFHKIITLIEKDYKVEGDLKEQLNENIKRLREIGCYRGIRHVKGLPVRGQRTKSNARTKRGKRKTIGALRKEVWAKLETQKTQEPAKAATK